MAIARPAFHFARPASATRGLQGTRPCGPLAPVTDVLARTADNPLFDWTSCCRRTGASQPPRSPPESHPAAALGEWLRFAADSWQNADAATRGQIERLKRQWRDEWEAEAEAEDATGADEAIHSINAKLERMRQRTEAAMSERTRALWQAFQQAQEQDLRRLPPPDDSAHGVADAGEDGR